MTPPLSTVFGVLVCPEYILVRPGGKVHETLIGADVDLEAEVQDLLEHPTVTMPGTPEGG